MSYYHYTPDTPDSSVPMNTFERQDAVEDFKIMSTPQQMADEPLLLPLAPSMSIPSAPLPRKPSPRPSDYHSHEKRKRGRESRPSKLATE